MGFLCLFNLHKKDINLIKGLAITPPILGRISIGKMVEKNGKRIPEKDDQFTITSQIQNKDSGWVKLNRTGFVGDSLFKLGYLT